MTSEHALLNHSPGHYFLDIVGVQRGVHRFFSAWLIHWEELKIKGSLMSGQCNRGEVAVIGLKKHGNILWYKEVQKLLLKLNL